ncbi:MAG: helix-turn-helix transcriptional regulator [Solobacterium sp.]|nr:helix-turn-helix transcriptional regulator [Solobacterium sp.]
MTIGEKITYARKKRGFSRVQLADLLQVSESQMYQWEKGIRNPKAKVLEAMRMILLVDERYFGQSIEENQLDDCFYGVPSTTNEVDKIVYLVSDEEYLDLLEDSPKTREKYINIINEYMGIMTCEELSSISTLCSNIFYKRIVRNQKDKE